MKCQFRRRPREGLIVALRASTPLSPVSSPKRNYMPGTPSSQVTENIQQQLPVTENKPTPFSPKGSRGETLEQTETKVNEDGKSSHESGS
jgi:hypothetical protein